MPIEASAFLLPSGARAVRADCSGIVSKEDAEGLLRQIDPGGPFHGLPILAVTFRLDKVAPDARSKFAQRSDIPSIENWTAVVVTSPLIRVTTNFVLRVARTRKHHLFATEQEAVRWLDERAREGAAP